MKLAFRISAFLLAWTFFAVPVLRAAESAPLRVVIAGLVHGHVEGFFANSLHRPEIRIVGITDPDRSLFDRYAAKFALDSTPCITLISKKMLRTAKPQAVLSFLPAPSITA